jgi:hypothetical protein
VSSATPSITNCCRRTVTTANGCHLMSPLTCAFATQQRQPATPASELSWHIGTHRLFSAHRVPAPTARTTRIERPLCREFLPSNDHTGAGCGPLSVRTRPSS